MKHYHFGYGRREKPKKYKCKRSCGGIRELGKGKQIKFKWVGKSPIHFEAEATVFDPTRPGRDLARD